MSAQEYYNQGGIPGSSTGSQSPSGPPPPYQAFPQHPAPQQYATDPKQGYATPPGGLPYYDPRQNQPQQPYTQQQHPQAYGSYPQQHSFPPQQYPPPAETGSLRPSHAAAPYTNNGGQQYLSPHAQPQFSTQQRPASASPFLEKQNRRRSRSRSRSRDRHRDRPHHRHRRASETKSTNRGTFDTFVGAGGGAIVGDLIFPGLGTVGGALLGGYGGHKVAQDKRARSHGERRGDRW